MAADPVYIVGNTHEFLLTATKDGAVWNITSATVTLYLQKPDGTILTKSATIVSGAAGTAQYTTLTTDLSVKGRWKRWWKVVDGAVDMEYGPVTFTVLPSPAA